MKIGLVTPYVYPLPGGVNEHVRHLYENLLARGHDVRIISSTHGLQQASEGDVIRLGRGFSVPTNGSVGTLTLSPRYLAQARDLLAAERFDLLHFHEPFVPFLSPILLRESDCVNVATFHAYAGWSPAYQSSGGRSAGRSPGCTAGSRSARRPATSSTATSRATTRSSPTASTCGARVGPPDRQLARRHAEHPVRRPLRGPQGPARPAQGVPHPAPLGPRRAGSSWWAPGRRSGRCGATSRRGASRGSSCSAG